MNGGGVELTEENTPHVALTADDNQVHYVKKVIPVLANGIYIMDVNHKVYTEEKWDALATKPEALGVAVKTDDCQFVIHSQHQSGLPWGQDSLVPNCFVSTNKDEALLDFNGKGNSEAVLMNQPDNVLFNWAKSLDFKGLEGYIPSSGELNTILNNFATINSLRTKIGQTSLNNLTGGIHSSSQYEGLRMWYCNMWTEPLDISQNYKYLTDYCSISVASF